MNFAENCGWVCQNVDCMISANVALTKFGNVLKEAVVAEWLRRLTRNQFPSGSVGSNPTDCENIFFGVKHFLTRRNVIAKFGPFRYVHRWFSGRMLACHAGGPGSIPGRCSYFLVSILWKVSWKKILETGGIDPPTSHMLSERSTIWATSPCWHQDSNMCRSFSNKLR